MDKQQLGDMGFIPKDGPEKPRRHYCCGYLDDWQFAQLVAAVMAMPQSEQNRKQILGALCAQDFPSFTE